MSASIQLFSPDLDGTLLGNWESTRRFHQAWNNLPRRQRPVLCYNSGRLVDDIIKLVDAKSLPSPDFIIGGVGTQLYDSRRRQRIAEFDEQFPADWDLAQVEPILAAFPGVEKQPPEFLHPYKSSWYLHHARPETVNAIRRQLAQAGLNVTVIYSSGRDLDALPANTSKGHALSWLCKRVGVPLEQVLVAGDTANDSSMFLLPGVRGIVVENAHPDLYESIMDLPAYGATRAFADGVLEGLAHFKVITQTPGREQWKLGNSNRRGKNQEGAFNEWLRNTPAGEGILQFQAR